MSLKFKFSQKQAHLTDQEINLYWQNFQKTISRADIGFFRLDDLEANLNECRSTFLKFSHLKNFIHVGLGGSSLGPEAMIESLQHLNAQKTNFLFLNNLDIDEIVDKIAPLELEKSLFYIVSKSGNTAETLAILSVILEKFKNYSKKLELNKHIVICTDPITSPLLDYARDHQLIALQIPQNIGGRFSALTCASFFPLCFLHPDLLNQISPSIKKWKTDLTENNQHWLKKTFSIICGLYNEGIDQTVLMPYSSKLKKFSLWFVQLWAESLGKIRLDQKVGLTPLFAYGPADQHSQMQLFMEGPNNKLLFFVKIKNAHHHHQISLPSQYQIFNQLNGVEIHDLNHAELLATQAAFDQKKLSYIELEIEVIDLDKVIGFLLFFESLTVYVSEYLKVDPFNQPGVELAKQLTFKIINEKK